jgi:[acyl-carrier-protein] S-malonyltransferase
MSETAWVFPGQGSQFVSMGRDLYAGFAEARAVFDEADEGLGFKLSQLCFEGPEAELTDTVNAQPALLTHSIAALKVVEALLGQSFARPGFAAGHSLGEYSALVATRSLRFADAVRLVRARGLAMKHAGERRPGAMAAILGLDDAILATICAKAGAVQVANYNAPGQIVISGEKEALDRALALAKQAGAKRAIPLAISIAAHSELMRPAIEEYRMEVQAVEVAAPQSPVISNITAQPLKGTEAIRQELLAQLTSPVEWVKSVQFMGAHGVTQYYEIGPKDVLAGLIRRSAPDSQATSLGTVEAITKLALGAPA